MDFSLAEEQEELKRLAAKVLAARGGKEQPGEGFDPPLWAELARAGLLGTAVPAGHDGAGGIFLDLCLLFEQQGRAAATAPLVETLTGALAVARFGDGALRARILPAV